MAYCNDRNCPPEEIPPGAIGILLMKDPREGWQILTHGKEEYLKKMADEASKSYGDHHYTVLHIEPSPEGDVYLLLLRVVKPLPFRELEPREFIPLTKTKWMTIWCKSIDAARHYSEDASTKWIVRFALLYRPK